MAGRVAGIVGRRIAAFLEREVPGYQSYAVTGTRRLRACLQPCDVLLVEGNTRVSASIKWLTHSNWSHAAFFVGEGDGRDLIEADLTDGVRYAGLERYRGQNTRICRPVGLSPHDAATVIAHMKDSVGRQYDLRNVIDLARYLLPRPPVPRRWRRRMLALGSGDPTRAICSTLIAEAFQKVRYPILPLQLDDCPEHCAREVLHIRHHSLFAPRDFDLSPYFRIVKPTIEAGFDYKAINWGSAVLGADGMLPDGNSHDTPTP